MRKLVFFSGWNYGDIHANKEYVRQAATKCILNDIDVCYATNKNSHVTNLPIRCESHLDHMPAMINAPSYFDPQSQILYINTWVGHHDMTNGHNFVSQRSMWFTLFRLIYESFGVFIELKEPSFYISKIDYGLITIPELSSNENKVLFCNNIATSSQSCVDTLETVVNQLAKKYKNVEFICTNRILAPSNVFFTDDINKVSGEGMDLPEIGYISEHCEIIVTNSSGPGTFAMTAKNLMDPSKIILAFVVSEKNTFWWGIDNIQATCAWTNSTDTDTISRFIDDRMKVKYGN